MVAIEDRLKTVPDLQEPGSLNPATGMQPLRTLPPEIEADLLNRATALDAAAEGIAITDARGLYTYINPAHVTLFGYSDLSEILGKSWKMFYREEEISYIEKTVFPILIQKKKWKGRLRGYRKDHSHFVQELCLNLLPDGGIACICSDATERIEAVEQRERLFAISKALMVICDFSGSIKQMNPAWSELLGIPMERLMSQPLFSHVYEADLAKTHRALGELEGGAQAVNFTNRYVAADGRLIHLDWSAAASASEGLIFASGHNVTSQVNAEHALRESEENFRTFFETVEDMIFVCSPDGRIVHSNRAVQAKLGYSKDAISKMRIIDVHPPELRSEAEEIVRDMFSGLRSVCLLPLQNSSGHQIAVETRIWKGRWDDRDCIFGVSKDITSEHEAQQRFERLFMNSPALMALTSLPDGRFLDVNTAFLSTLGYSREEIAGKTASELKLFPDEARALEIFDQCRSEGRVLGEEVQARRKNGMIIHGLISAEIISIKGQPHMLSAVADISRIKRAEQSALQNVARAEELNRLKSRFVSMASHELRTPLANILLSRDLLRNFGDSLPRQRAIEVLDGLTNSVNQMVRMLDDLLLTGRLDEGRLVCNPVPIILQDILRDCCENLGQPGEPGTRIRVKGPRLGTVIRADKHLLTHVLKNLLENALKYSPESAPVEVHVDAAKHSITISVIDAGIGIPEADRSDLFHAFYRATNVGDLQGSGLGLFVAQRCAQAHGGRMAYSPRNQGSIFSLVLPRDGEQTGAGH